MENKLRNELDIPVEVHSYTHMNIPSGYLRISITDICNMNCSYCHNEGQGDIKSKYMNIEHLRYIVTNALRYGLIKVRLTGGEPLLHPDCYNMLRLLKKELAIPTVGFNTNGILLDKLIPIVTDRLIDDLVIGVDYADGKISKDSKNGLSSELILEHILTLKKLGQKVSIACVYDGDYSRLEKLAFWCIENEIILKILEICDNSIHSKISDEFISMTKKLLDRFSMKLGLIVNLAEYYGLINDKPKIYFFQSHCRLRECKICAKIHLRVTTDGFIKSCILNDIRYPLLYNSFDDSMLKIISNLGNPPQVTNTFNSSSC